MDFETVRNYLLSFEGTALVFPFGEEKSVFVIDGGSEEFDPRKMFAMIDKKAPVNLNLRCDFKLGKTLQHRYESVLPGHNLSSGFITVILSGQLEWSEVQDLIRHAYLKTVEQNQAR